MSDMMSTEFHATTIVAVQRNGKTAIAGDGQVTMGNAVMEPPPRSSERCAARSNSLECR